MQKSLLLVPLIALSLFTPAYAASPSPSPTPQPSPASINEVTENLKKRLQDSLEEPESTPLSQALGYVGVVKDIIKDTVIIEDKDGKRDVKLTDDTNILRSPGNAVIKRESIRIDDHIIAIGYKGDGENLNGRRLIVSADPLKVPAKTTDLGVITKIGKTSLTLSIRGEDQTINTTAKTIYKSPTGIIEYTDLAESDTVIYTATIDADDDLTATHLMRILSASIAE